MLIIIKIQATEATVLLKKAEGDIYYGHKLSIANNSFLK